MERSRERSLHALATPAEAMLGVVDTLRHDAGHSAEDDTPRDVELRVVNGEVLRPRDRHERARTTPHMVFCSRRRQSRRSLAAARRRNALAAWYASMVTCAQGVRTNAPVVGRYATATMSGRAPAATACCLGQCPAAMMGASVATCGMPNPPLPLGSARSRRTPLSWKTHPRRSSGQSATQNSSSASSTTRHSSATAKSLPRALAVREHR